MMTTAVAQSASDLLDQLLRDRQLNVPDDGAFHLIKNKPSNGGGYQVYVNLTDAIIRLRGVDAFNTEAHVLPSGNLVMKYSCNGLEIDPYFMYGADDLSVGITPEELVKRWVQKHGHDHHIIGLRFLVRLFKVPAHLLWSGGELELFQMLGRLGIPKNQQKPCNSLSLPDWPRWSIFYELHQSPRHWYRQGSVSIMLFFDKRASRAQVFHCLISRDGQELVPLNNLAKVLLQPDKASGKISISGVDCHNVLTFAPKYYPRHKGDLHGILMRGFGFHGRRR